MPCCTFVAQSGIELVSRAVVRLWSWREIQKFAFNFDKTIPPNLALKDFTAKRFIQKTPAGGLRINDRRLKPQQ